MTFPQLSPGPRRPFSGFTIIEIMLVVVIIGLLASMGLPVWARARRNAQNAAFINDLRIATYAAQTYSFEFGTWAPDVGTGVAPPELIPYLNKLNWTEVTPLGGHWDWENNNNGCLAGISISNYAVPNDQLQEIDVKIDDGISDKGRFQSRGGNGYIYILE